MSFGVYFGPTDTDLAKALPIAKNDPADVVAAVLDGVEANKSEVIADAISVQAKADLALDPAEIYAPTGSAA